MIKEEITEFFTGCRVVGNNFRNDILRARDRLVRRFYFFGKVFFRLCAHVQRFILRQNSVGKGL